MTKLARRRLEVLAPLIAAVMVMATALIPAAQARAQSLYTQPKYAAIVVDATTGEVLYARRADQPRYPASITKVMTLYLVFEALATGRLSLDDKVTLSAHAASQPPSKSGLRAGESISVDTAIRLAALKSANDIAVALAEKVGGSEPRFAALMTLRAQELGMMNTRFVNANGLPDTRHVTTARDIAILSRAIMRDYPQYYAYFSQRAFDFRGQHITNHNGLLRKMPGVDGIKTGFTNAAGFTLAASAVRDGRRLIAVVLGGQSTAARDENVEDLLNAGFEVLDKRKTGQTITVAANMNEPDDVSGPVMRPAVEMGSGEQDGLKVVVSDNQLRGSQQPAMGDAAAGTWLSGAESTASPSLKAATLALSEPAPAETARSACRTVTQKVHLKATKTRKARTVTRAKTVCDDAAVVASKDAPAAPSKPAPREQALPAGDYRIQVGAFGSKSAAQQHLTKISKRYATVVADASSEVEAARKGTYRARFNGFSAKAAKAACATLAAKGERCMVVAPARS